MSNYGMQVFNPTTGSLIFDSRVHKGGAILDTITTTTAQVVRSYPGLLNRTLFLVDYYGNPANYPSVTISLVSNVPTILCEAGFSGTPVIYIIGVL